jgi:hypothetical protein
MDELFGDVVGKIFFCPFEKTYAAETEKSGGVQGDVALAANCSCIGESIIGVMRSSSQLGQGGGWHSPMFKIV